MLSFPRRRRGKDNRQLYSIPDITSFILVYQRDNHILFCKAQPVLPNIRLLDNETVKMYNYME